MKLRVEAWRIVKFILITLAVNLPSTLVNGRLVNALVANGQPGIGDILAALTYANALLSTALLTLLHRYFTFRATEKWYIALPIMLIAAIVWQLVQSLMLTSISKLGVNAVTALVALLPFIWPVLSYLLQRCVIYCHTTDQNGWYCRFHPTNDEKECTPL